MMAANEQQLILQVKEGSKEAFRSLVEQYMKQAYNIAYGFVKDHDDAEDIAQESFVRIYQSIKSFRGDAGFATWLYRIVTNLSLNRLRQKKNITKVNTEVINTIIQETFSNSFVDELRDVKLILEYELHKLPTLQRAVVILRHLNGLSTKQVSGILKCSEGTVKTHLHRGLKKMKNAMNLIKEEVL